MKYGDFKLNKESVDKFFPKEDIDMSGYESPINVLMGQMRMEQEDNIFRAVQEYGVDVNKEELIKALHYDRDQYRKGYADGYDDGYNASKWISVDERLPEMEGLYLAFTFDKRIVFCQFYDPFCEDNPQFSSPLVTHWQPLPEAPKEVQDEQR